MNPNQPNQPKRTDVPSIKSDIKPESDPSVVTSSEGKADAAAEGEPDDLIEVVVTSQVMLGEQRDRQGNLLTGGRVAKRGEVIKVTREFMRRHRGDFVETKAEFERQERKARGEDDF